MLASNPSDREAQEMESQAMQESKHWATVENSFIKHKSMIKLLRMGDEHSQYCQQVLK